MTAEQLFDEAQALMRSLPSNIGKAKAAGRLTPRQTANLARLDEIEKILPQGSPEWQRIWAAIITFVTGLPGNSMRNGRSACAKFPHCATYGKRKATV